MVPEVRSLLTGEGTLSFMEVPVGALRGFLEMGAGIPHAPLELTAADFAQLRPIADRAALTAALAERPSLAGASDLTLSAAPGTGASVASATRRVPASWG